MAVAFKFFLFTFLFYMCNSENVKSRYYPRYHLSPPSGWMNDPNGFSFFQNKYHLFYQHNPNSSQEPGNVHWGHAISKNLVEWEHLPIALYPDQSYDKNGVFSGSALVENGKMYAYYTGNVNLPGETPDHKQIQALAESTDGVQFTKYEKNPIIDIAELQPDLRDPKVWKRDDKYYMVLGHSINSTYGEILLFISEDKINWKQASVLLRSNGSLGFMFECPDFFELDGRHVLLFSPQGIKPDGDKYRNLYQTGYVVGDFDYETNVFIPETKFQELDHGHDFYATQTIDDDGSRVMVAWMDMWEQVYPERNDGFTGMMTIPRILSLTRKGKLLQKPIPELKDVRREILYFGASIIDPIELPDKSGEITIRSHRNSPLVVVIGSPDAPSNHSSVKITYEPKKRTITLDRGGEDGIRRTQWKPRGFILKLRIFIDASSVEIFCGYGETTLSSRFFPTGPVRIKTHSPNHSSVRVISIGRTVPEPN